MTIAGIVLYTSARKDLSASVSMARHQAANAIRSLSGRGVTIANSEEIEKYFHSGREVVVYRLFQASSDQFQYLAYLGVAGNPEVVFINGRLAEEEQPPDDSQGFLSALNTPERPLPHLRPPKGRSGQDINTDSWAAAFPCQRSRA